MNRRGTALIFIVFLSVFLVPVALMQIYQADLMNRLLRTEWQSRSAQALATNAVLDYMRAFSQNPFVRYEGDASFDRPDTFYGVGFSNVSFARHPGSLYVKAAGKLGGDINAPSRTKTLHATISFFSDATRYGTVFLEDTPLSGPNLFYQGGYYVKGNLSTSGINTRWDGGPLVVEGDLTLNGSTTVDADIYLGGTFTPNGATVNGTVYPYVPTLSLISTDPSFYLDNSNIYRSNASEEWTFGVDGATGRGYFDVVGGPPPHHYEIPVDPSDGVQRAIIVMNNGTVSITGSLRGRVMLVCTGSDPNGVVTVKDDFVYANGLDHADQNHSFGLLAVTNVLFEVSGPTPQTFTGMLLASKPTPDFETTSAGDPLTLVGVRMRRVDHVGTGFNVIYDPELTKYPPPGLPERAALTTYRLR